MTRYLVLFGLFAAMAGKIHAQAVTIHFSDGQELEAEILSVNSQSVRWRLPTGSSISDIPLNRVAWVDFIPSEEWEKAEEELGYGHYNEAGRLYAGIALNRDANFYPVPGNFSSLALKRILECHRRLLNAEKVAEIAKQIEPIIKTLPPREQKFSPEDTAWIFAGRKKWPEVIQTAKSAPRSTELAYLSGVANRILGNAEESLDGFTAAYTLGFGSYPEIAKASLRASAEMLSNLDDEERMPELQALLKIYKDLYGKGKLWDEAPDRFVKLANAKLETLGAEGEGGEMNIPPIPGNLPPLKDRDWLLAIEAEPAVFWFGKGAFDTVEVTAPKKQGHDLVFSGKEFMQKAAVQIDAPLVRFRAVFIPKKKDGVLLHVGKDGPGFSVYLKGGQIMLAWREQADKLKEISLGPVMVGSQTSMVLSIGSGGTVMVQADAKPNHEAGKVTTPIKLSTPTLAEIAPVGKGRNSAIEGLPRFEGVIRHLSVGLARSSQEYVDYEKKLFGGKKIVRTVPKPK